MSIKLIAIDLDGTMLKNDCTISKRTKEAIEAAAKSGCYIVPTTGRSYRNAREVLKNFTGLRYFINANGATVTDGQADALVYAEVIPYEISRQIYDLASQEECFQEIYEDLDAHVDIYGREFLTRAGLSNEYVDQLLSTNVQHSCLDDFMEQDCRRISKFHIVCQSSERKEHLKRKLQMLPHVYPISVISQNIEIVNGHWSKAQGLHMLTQTLGLEASQVMAIGDSDNDLDMLKWAGISVGMGNANAHVKEAVDYVTASNEEDGIVQAMERFL